MEKEESKNGEHSEQEDETTLANVQSFNIILSEMQSKIDDANIPLEFEEPEVEVNLE